MKILKKRRRKENKTNYLKRRRLLEGEKARIVIRKTNKYIILQYVESEVAKDKVKITTTSRELLKNGWPKEKAGSLKNLTACYLTGLLFGKKIIAGKDKEAILDTGLIRSTMGSRIYAALKGIVDSGVKVKHNPKVLPDEKRITNVEFFDTVKSKITGGSK
jgi:large subunit ribosomal protein L18